MVNTSAYGLDAVMRPIKGRTEYKIGFASRPFSPTEYSYSEIEKEMLACVWTIESICIWKAICNQIWLQGSCRHFINSQS